MPNYGDFEIEENDELGIDPHLALQGGFDDELGALASGSSKAHNAAVSLRDYLVRTNNFGSDTNKVPEIAAYQRDMGMGSNAIGIVGPRTRARATELNVTLPEKRTNTNGGTNTAKEAAGKLRDYLLATNSFGSESHRDETVKGYQQQMGMAALGVKKFGIVGPLTRKTAAKYGVTLPQPKQSGTGETKPTVITSTNADRKSAAQGLKAYLVRTGDFGSEDKRSPTVREYQRLMGMVPQYQIGIVGPRTRILAKHLGSELPPKPSVTQTSKPSTVSTPDRKSAAVSLRDYLAKTNDFGSSRHRSSNVATYQRGMGMGANAIGIVGPRTRALAHALGVTLPTKHSAATTKTTHKTSKVTRLPEQKSMGHGRRLIGGDEGSKQPLWTIAEGLRRYLVSSGDFGTKEKPSQKVAEYQRGMGQLTVDGVVGRKTRARADGLLHEAARIGKWSRDTPTSLPPRPADKRRTLKPITERGKNRVRKHIDDAFKSEQQKAKEKLMIIDKLSDAYPDIPIWDTYKWRKRVIDLLKVAAGGKC